jgi:hypothetical protein
LIEIEEAELQGIFSLDKTILEGARVIWTKVWRRYLRTNRQDRWERFQKFLTARNLFYQEFPEGIFKISARKQLINFVKSFVNVAILANDVELGVDVGFFSQIIGILVVETYGTGVGGQVSPILRHVETYLAQEEDVLFKHMVAYQIKLIENCLWGAVWRDDQPAKVIQSLVKIEGVADVEKLDIGVNSVYLKKNCRKGGRWDYEDVEIPLGDSVTDKIEELVGILEKRGLGANYVQEGYVGLNDIVAWIVGQNDRFWRRRSPTIGGGDVQFWFDNFKIHSYSLEPIHFFRIQRGGGTDLAWANWIICGRKQSSRGGILYVGDNPPTMERVSKNLESSSPVDGFIVGRKFPAKPFYLIFFPPGKVGVKDQFSDLSLAWVGSSQLEEDKVKFDCLSFLRDLFGDPILVGTYNNPGKLFSFDYPGDFYFATDLGYYFTTDVPIQPDQPTMGMVKKKRVCAIRMQNCQF